MRFFLTNFTVLAFATLTSWWLSGFDSKLTGENDRSDFIRRAIRCGTSLFLVELGFWNLWRYWRYNDSGSGIVYLFIALPLVAIWCGCLSEMVAHGFHWLIDPGDHREFDPHAGRRDLDTIAGLIQEGRKEEAIQLCQRLKESGGASVLALDTMLERLGVKPDNVKKARPLAEADRLRSQGKWPEAETLLQSLLAENPSNVDAALLLMRLYAQDLRRSDKASEVLRSLPWSRPHPSNLPAVPLMNGATPNRKKRPLRSNLNPLTSWWPTGISAPPSNCWNKKSRNSRWISIRGSSWPGCTANIAAMSSGPKKSSNRSRPMPRSARSKSNWPGPGSTNGGKGRLNFQPRMDTDNHGWHAGTGKIGGGPSQFTREHFRSPRSGGNSERSDEREASWAPALWRFGTRQWPIRAHPWLNGFAFIDVAELRR
jgi:hypothetical protein